MNKDETQAFKWYSQAALAGNAEAQVNLASAYAQGLGVDKDLVKAYAWYSLAKKQPIAAANLDAVAKLMDAAQIQQAGTLAPTLLTANSSN